ncbi:MAG: hypothetical protein MUE83_16760 [Tabrizicola sp.]|jgi:hypothetical protein|nr:hypothetical protein [Tabrizicola sp.]
MPFRILAAATMSIGLALAGVSDVNVVVTDGSGRFSEGWLEGFVVHQDGKPVCAEPYAIGKFISCQDSIAVANEVWKAPMKPVWVETSGILGAMVVLDAEGAVVCENPVVDISFRSPNDVISCGKG